MTQDIHRAIESEKPAQAFRECRFNAWYNWKKTGLQAYKDLYEHYTNELKKVGEV